MTAYIFFIFIDTTTRTLNPRFRRGRSLRCGSSFFRLKTMIFFLAEKYGGTRTSKHSCTKTERPPHRGGLSVLVRGMGLEPTRRSTHAPQTCLSAYSSTLAYSCRFRISKRYYSITVWFCQPIFAVFKRISYAFYESNSKVRRYCSSVIMVLMTRSS